MKRLFFLILFLLFPLNLEAKDNEFIIECDKFEFQEFEDFACRTKINSSFNYDKITFDIISTNGVILKEARTNYTLLWQVSSKKSKVTAETLRNRLVNGFQEFGILLFSISEYGKQNVEIKNIILTNMEEKETLKLDDIKIEFIMQSSENRLKEIKIDGVKIANFSVDNFNYYLETNAEALNLEVTPLDKNAKMDGIGEIKLNPKVRETIIPITVISENGINRIYKLFIINNSIIKNDISASLIELFDDEGNKINFNFKSDVYVYDLELASNIKKISTKVTVENKEFSLVKDYGNQTINIQKGDNLVLIKIKDSSGDIKTYIFNITKLLSNKSSNNYLKNINIEDYSIKFNKRVKQYNLDIKRSDKVLNINAIPEDNKSIVNIIGNEDLKDGSIIKIIVKAENESKITYQLHIMQKETGFLNYFVYLIITLFLIGLIIKNLNKVKKFINDIFTKPKAKKVEEIKNKNEVSKKQNKKVVTKKIEPNKEVKKKPVKKSNANNKSSSSKVSATKKKPVNKKNKKKIAKNKKRNIKK